jgi:hypothetical protein
MPGVALLTRSPDIEERQRPLEDELGLALSIGASARGMSVLVGEADRDLAVRALTEGLRRGWLSFGYFTLFDEQLLAPWLEARVLPGPGQQLRFSLNYQVIARPDLSRVIPNPRRGFRVHSSVGTDLLQERRGDHLLVRLLRPDDDERALELDLVTGAWTEAPRRTETRLRKGRYGVFAGVPHGVYATDDGPVFFAGERRFLLAWGDYAAISTELGGDERAFGLTRDGVPVYETVYAHRVFDPADEPVDVLRDLATDVGAATFNLDYTLNPPPEPPPPSIHDIDDDDPFNPFAGPPISLPDYEGLDYSYEDYTGIDDD